MLFNIKKVIYTITFIVYIFLMILATSCSPEKRLKRLLEKHPELVKTDTTYSSDTTFVTLIKADTVVKWYYLNDTIRLTNDKLTVKTYFNHRDTTVYVYGKCDADTIIKEIPLIVQTVKPRHWLLDKLDQFTGLFVFVVVLYVLIRSVQIIAPIFKK